jgi:hypothetical protein
MVTLQVESKDSAVKASREATCNLVIGRFRFDYPGEKLLCFIDDKDFALLKTGDLKGNRGGFVPNFYRSILSGFPPLPDYVKRMHDFSHMLGHAYSSLIYVHGSTCEPRASLVITLAHELEHFTQFSQELRLYEADMILRDLRGYRPDLPSESDAFLISKQIAIEMCGETPIRDYANGQMEVAEAVDKPRWEYFLSLSLYDPPTFADKTRQQCREHQTSLNAMIAENVVKYQKTFPRFDFSKPDWWEE